MVGLTRRDRPARPVELKNIQKERERERAEWLEGGWNFRLAL